MAIDIERSTGPLRTNPIKEELRSQVYRLLCDAMTYSGIDAGQRDPFEDRGDGVLALIHPVDAIPKAYLLSRFVPELTRLLIDYNLGLPAAEWSRRGLKLRAVVHAGEIHWDANGPFGESLDVACRLLNAPKLKKLLLSASVPLVLVVSEDIYWSVVNHEYDGIRAASYRADIRVRVAGRQRRGWIHLPSSSMGLSAPGATTHI